MTHAELRSLALAVLAAFIAIILLSGCETGGTARALPPYEAPIAKSEFQHVRTTAYTHTEADHTQYGARNALGGALRPAGPAFRSAANVRQARTVSTDNDDVDVINISSSDAMAFILGRELGRIRLGYTRLWKEILLTYVLRIPYLNIPITRVRTYSCDRYGAFLAPAGVRGLIIAVSLSGRNTIDLYMANQRDMNQWGARQEPIQILHWGDPRESLQFLQSHQDYKHIRRMVLELKGRDQEAAALQ